MNNKAELVTQLRRMCDLIYERDQADYKREEINGRISQLYQES